MERNPRQARADSRNRRRVQEVDRTDATQLGKYLPSFVDRFLPDIVHAPDDWFSPPAWLLESIRQVAESPVKTPSKPGIRFEVSPEALQHNSDLLKGFDYTPTSNSS
jgi:hypothetical protein